jgi:hypothetical protein
MTAIPADRRQKFRTFAEAPWFVELYNRMLSERLIRHKGIGAEILSAMAEGWRVQHEPRVVHELRRQTAILVESLELLRSRTRGVCKLLALDPCTVALWRGSRTGYCWGRPRCPSRLGYALSRGGLSSLSPADPRVLYRVLVRLEWWTMVLVPRALKLRLLDPSPRNLPDATIRCPRSAFEERYSTKLALVVPKRFAIYNSGRLYDMVLGPR